MGTPLIFFFGFDFRISFTVGLGGDGVPGQNSLPGKFSLPRPRSPSPGQIYSLPAGFPVPEFFSFAYKTYLNTLCMK